MSFRNIVLIRHGKTKGNLERRYVGETDESLLFSEAERLRERRGVYPKADFVFVSPMVRCMETAEILYPECMESGRFEIVADLRECAFGEFEYKNYRELTEDPGTAKAYQEFIDSMGECGFPGGESKKQFCRRTAEAFRRICAEPVVRECDTAAVVAHGGTLMAILDAYSVPHRDYYDWQAGNAEGYIGRLCTDSTGGEYYIDEIRKIEER